MIHMKLSEAMANEISYPKYVIPNTDGTFNVYTNEDIPFTPMTATRDFAEEYPAEFHQPVDLGLGKLQEMRNEV
jgi:hypothetical protein